MRFLHTSDWHLGRLFHGTSLLDEQAAAVDRMVEVATEHRVDAVLVAGDLFDRAIPPAPAVELLDEALLRLRDTGAIVVAISGNHDSPTRVGYGERIMSRAGVTVRAEVRRSGEPVIVPSGDGGPGVAVYALPFVDPVSAAHATPASDGNDPDQDGPRRRPTHEQAVEGALQGARADRRRRRGTPTVVMAHAFVASAAPRLDEAPVTTCDSERELTAGGTGRVGPSTFAGFDAVVLGHLHGHQSWGDGRIAYSGSPLRYSFSEEHHTKCVRVVDLGADGSLRAELVELGVGRSLRTLTGTLAELLADPALRDAEQARVRAVLTDVELPRQAMAQLRTRFPFTAELVHRPPDRPGHTPMTSGQDVRRRQPLDLALQFLADQWGEDPDPPTRTLLRRAVTEVLEGSL
jgi:DNA repair protein SbcD/Mre11